MASQSILRASVRSPIHALGLLSPKPAQATKSILKKPTPLPLHPLPSHSTISIIISSPHVHFPSSPVLASTFTAYSPNTYDRGPIIVSPSLESPGLKGWANRRGQLSPSAYDAFKLLDAPRGRQTRSRAKTQEDTQLLSVPVLEYPHSPKPYKAKATEVHKTVTPKTRYLSVPALEDPRSPKPYKSRAGRARKTQLLSVPASEDPRSPKPYKAATTAGPLSEYLSVPVLEDPRSPKPYKQCPGAGTGAGMKFQEMSMHVPRAAGELGRALVTYPRSPYPSAPIEGDEDTMDMVIDKDTGIGVDLYTHANTDIGADIDMDTERGRSPTRSTSKSRFTKNNLRVQPPSRARSLENESTSTSQSKSKSLYRLPTLPHVFSPLGLNFLTPVTEPASISPHLKPKPKSTPAPAPLDLETQFWESVTLEEAGSELESAYMTATSSVGLSSPAPSVNIMFGNKDGGVWSPRVSARNVNRNVRGEDIGCVLALSPAQRKVFSKGTVASPSPHDPLAAFPSFTVAMMGGGVNIAYPPRARVVREV